MCQWFNAQYETLRRQIDRLQFDRITPNGPGVISGAASDWDYSFGQIQQQVDIVTANIDQAEDFLAPRVQALTQSQDYVGDTYFPIYEGKELLPTVAGPLQYQRRHQIASAGLVHRAVGPESQTLGDQDQPVPRL